MFDTGSTYYRSKVLTNVSLAYRNENYIGGKVYPTVQVKQDTAQIATYGMDNLRVEKTLRGIGAATKEVNHSVTVGDHYTLKDHALKELVPDELINNAEDPISPKTDAVEAVTDMMQVAKEKAVADILQSTGVMTRNTTLTGTDQWNDYVNSDPFADIKTAKNSVRTYSGKKANTMIIAYDALETLLCHPDVLARFPGAPAVTYDMLAANVGRLFGLGNVLVGDAQYNSADEGQTGTLGDIWSKSCVIAYIEKSPTLKSRSLGFTYQQKAPRYVDGWRDNDRKGEWVRVNDKFDQKLIDANCGYLIYACIA
jgi:hypothetical protein